MDIFSIFGKIMKRTLKKSPKTAYKLLRFGVGAGRVYFKITDYKAPRAYRQANDMTMRCIGKALAKPQRAVLTNMFAPYEILTAMDIPFVPMEALSAAMTLMNSSDYFIDMAEGAGIANTLCSFQRNFCGIIESGMIPPLGYGVTTSTICDGNIGTFRYASEALQMPLTLLDVPQQNTPEDVAYLTAQLKDFIAEMEKFSGKTFDMEKLRKAIRNSNLSRQYYREFLEKSATHVYPSKMIHHVYSNYPTHMGMGSDSTLKLFDDMRHEVEKYPDDPNVKRILWVHTLPFFHKSLASLLDYNKKYVVQCCELNLDFMDPLDEEHPLEAVAVRMIDNVYNREYARKVEHIEEYIKKMGADAVVCFNHWGCKQAFGGTVMVKKRMSELGIPCLVLDGDGIDSRNCPEGQIKTRLEAFFEILDGEEKA